MRITLAVVLLGVVMTGVAGAVDYSVVAHEPVRWDPLGTQIKIHSIITNLDTEPLEYSVVKQLNGPFGWSASICLGADCLRPDIDSAFFYLAPGDFDTISTYINAFVNEGIGQVRFDFLPLGDPGNNKTQLYTGISSNVSTLLVRGDAAAGSDSAYSVALPGGQVAGVWDPTIASPPADVFTQFDRVIWFTGDSGGTFHPDAQTTIDGYIEQGGHFLVTGADIASNICDPASPGFSQETCDFLAQTLRTSYVEEHSMPIEVRGVPGDLIGDGIELELSQGGVDPDAVSGTSGGVAFLEYEGTAKACGIRWGDGDSRVVFLPFTMKSIADHVDRVELIAKVFAFFGAADVTAPDLAVGVFQNPYLTQYLDLYMISDEPLDDLTVSFRVNTIPISMSLIDADENLWRGSYEVTGTGQLVLEVDADDPSGNSGTIKTSFIAAKMTPAGGSLQSEDGRFKIDVNRGTLSSEEYALLFEGSTATAGKRESTDVVWLSSGSAKSSDSWLVSPRGLLDAGSAEISIIGAGDRSNPPAIHVENRQLETYEGNGALFARTSQLGRFSLAPATTSPVKPADHSYAALRAASPNPFNPVTRIAFEIRASQHVLLDVYDVAGRRMVTLIDEQLAPGVHEVLWDGKSDDGADAASGVYFSRLRTANAQRTEKLMLVK